MQALGVLGVVVIRCAEEFDRRGVVLEGVKFGKVEVLSDFQVDEDGFVCMKGRKRIVEVLECVVVV